MLEDSDYGYIDRVFLSLAKKYSVGIDSGAFDNEDLYQDGWVALLECKEKKDEENLNNIEFVRQNFKRISGHMLNRYRYMRYGSRSEHTYKNKYQTIYLGDEYIEVSHNPFFEDRVFLLELIAKLSERNRFCVIEYFVNGRTFDDIGKEIGRTGSLVWCIIKEIKKNFIDQR